MENYCKQCGMCCSAISLVHDIETLRSKIETNKDAKFIVDNWVPITQEEALQINPHLQNWLDKIQKHKLYFYRCTQFDSENKLCKIHNSQTGLGQPRICSGYPMYENGFIRKGELFYSLGCGYDREDLKEKDEFIEK